MVMTAVMVASSELTSALMAIVALIAVTAAGLSVTTVSTSMMIVTG